MILIPSAPMLTVIPIDLFGYAGGILVILIYSAGLFNVFRCLYLCSVTDPGIIP